MNDIFHISKLLIKKRLKILTLSEELQLKKFNKQYPFSKNIKIEDLVDKIDDYAAINKEKAWESIQKKSQKIKDKTVFKISNKKWYQYAAAALIIGILATAYLLKETLINKPIENTPIIVKQDVKVILPGSDKATLTLEDGSVVILEKGNDYQSQNVNSNGQQIVYKAGDKKTSEIAFNYLTIPRGGQFHVVLADGTEVWLNSESQLKYPITFIEGKARVVELVYGEAYFDVSPSTENQGAEFKVFNRSQEVEVLGTEFNIKAYKDETNIYTTLVEGEVAISSGSQYNKLIPGQQSNLNLGNQSITIAKVDVNAETSWRNGIFSFRGKSLKEIMKVISRWYDVDVAFENEKLEDITFKGVLGKNQDIKEILETIKSLSVIKTYEINGKQIILK